MIELRKKQFAQCYNDPGEMSRLSGARCGQTVEGLHCIWRLETLSHVPFEGRSHNLLDYCDFGGFDVCPALLGCQNIPLVVNIVTRALQKSPIHFRIEADCFEKSQGSVKVNGFKNYRFEDESEQLAVKLLKKGVKLSNIKKTVLEPLPLSHHISAEKKKDVEKLLKLLHGEDWQNEPENAFKWYKTILYDLPDGNDEEEEVCDCLDNDIRLLLEFRSKGGLSKIKMHLTSLF
ncbi:hypothetical protein J6590_035169 [Homalodisca vitripennis]|nr:hypothetical protein J6590_035169 [Homalodisca vitripennis]